MNQHASLIGGCEQYIWETVRLLRQRGIHSTLFYDDRNPADPAFLGVFDQTRTLSKLQAQLPAIDPDIVYLHQIYDDNILSSLLELQVPVIRFFHDHWLFCLRRNKLSLFSNRPCESMRSGCTCYPFGISIGRKSNGSGLEVNTLARLRRSQRLNQHFQGFVVGSHYMSRVLEANGFSADKTAVLPLYCPEADLGAADVQRDPRQLLFIGALLRGKGLDVLMEAMTFTQSTCKLKVVGEGRQGSIYRKLVDKLGLQTRVEFLGRLGQKERDYWLQQSASLVFPVRWPEPFGLVGPEAMRCATPVIASRIGGIPEWLEDEKTGLLVSPNDPTALAQAIDRICLHPSMARAMGVNARRSYLQRFQPERHIEALLGFFQQLLHSTHPPRRLTVAGSDALEERLEELLRQVIGVVKAGIPESERRALVLFGGYGKGEGGVELRDGVEWPHNNLDFLLVASNAATSTEAELKRRLRGLIAPIAELHGITFDLSVFKEKRLMRSAPLLIWYELVHGHRLLLGDSSWMTSLPLAQVSHVPVSDIHALMVNRGTLLVVNAWMLDVAEPLSPLLRRVFVKHMMKGIVGFGDALLYFSQQYHWSYRERQRRMQTCDEVSPIFRRWYQEALEFRFRPHYDQYVDRDLVQWLQEVLDFTAQIYLRCEAARLGRPALTWEQYPDTFLIASAGVDLFSRYGVVNRVKGLLHPPHHAVGTSWQARLAFRWHSPRQRLAAVFPSVAFSRGTSRTQSDIGRFLGAPDRSPEALRRAYLVSWRALGDSNFAQSLEQWGLRLDYDLSNR